MSIDKLEEAEKICKKGLTYQPKNQPLKSLLGIIQAKIDSNFLSETKISNTTKGLFSDVSKEDAIKIIRMIEGK